jgi:hypothetical protein
MPLFSNQEYADLKAFLDFYSARYLGALALPPDLRPIAGLEMLEDKSYRAANEGLKQAINDIIEQTRRMDLVEVMRIDAELRRNSLLTLSELRRRFGSEYKSILKRNVIRSEPEYYLVKGILCDAPDILSDDEKRVLLHLAEQFELKRPNLQR